MVPCLPFMIWGMSTFRKRRQEVVVPILETSAKLICISMENFNMAVLWFSYIVFVCITILLHIISKFVMSMVALFKNVLCRAKMRVSNISVARVFLENKVNLLVITFSRHSYLEWQINNLVKRWEYIN